ncbi:MAG: S9 family peptidase [Flavobacteriaceae bacterium]|nr:MAG: S9 family peptidase [Flavobacteriaceae bacterium]
MRNFNVALLLCFLLASPLLAQKKAITLEEIWDGTFRTESMEVLHSMKNGQQYSVLNQDQKKNISTIDIYDYRTLQKTRTFVSSADFFEFDEFSDYTFSEDETKVILATEVEPIFRRSKRAKYYVYDSTNNSVQAISEEKIQEPTFSPDGTKIAYGFNNDLYVHDLLSERTKRLTNDGLKNEIINGITDWVYEEEFSFVRAFEWNSKSDRIAFLKFDETFVPEFTMDVYGDELYPTQQKFKYPKAGELNSEVSLYIYDLLKSESKKVFLNQDYDNHYIPRIKWTNDPQILSAQYMNRHQNKLELWLINANGYESLIALQEEDKAYIDVTFDLTFLPDNSFIWTSEKSGNNHIYHHSRDGKLIRQVTEGNWEVTSYYGYDPANKKIFYQSTENGSTNRGVYSIGLNGKNKKALVDKEGQSRASFSADHSYFINSFSSATIPPQYTLNNSSTGNVVKIIEDNKDLANKVSGYQVSDKEFSTISVNGNDLNMWMIKPPDFSKSKKYPLLMYQYSGPGSQSVANRWNSSNDYWYQMLAQQGYIVACVDGRGTGLKGAAFKKVTQNELGKFEVEDQIQVARQLGQLSYIDEDNIGIWGWSYGGFMSSNAILKGNDVFKMAIAVAPVTSWRFYDTIYTERYMMTPDENPSGYDDNSPINHVDKLKGHYMIVHGTGDDNVHVQNTMRMVEALIQADKDFEWMVYPDRNHGIFGGNTRKHLYRKMTNFINSTIGNNSTVSNNNVSKAKKTQVVPKSNNRSKPKAIKVDNVEEAENVVNELDAKETSLEVEAKEETTIEEEKVDAQESVESMPTKNMTAEEIRKVNEAYLAKKALEEGNTELTREEKKAKKAAEKLKKKQEREAKKTKDN